MRALAALLLCGALGAATAADAPADEEFAPSDVIRGKRSSKEECAATVDAVWVEHRMGSECIRYFPSDDAAGAKRAAAGHHVTLVPAQARGSQRHGLAHMANRVMGWCNAGFSDERIVQLAARNAMGLHAQQPKPGAASGSTVAPAPAGD